MKTFLKTLIGGALGIGALYVVGKVCYEAGKDMAEVERQLEKQRKSAGNFMDKSESEGGDEVSGGEQLSMDLDADDEKSDPADVMLEKAKKEMSEAIDELYDKHTKPTWAGKLANTIQQKTSGLRALIRAKKALGGTAKEPGVLGTLLKNPDGARIEACIENGGVRINVRPRTAAA